ncbi:MAG: PilZ domain-containing protein [Planctomycetes bacterium]|nr:PilZ domain-containing protein [Planctomycetota bacterium]
MDQGLLNTLGRRSAQRICLRADVGILDEATGERTLGRLRDLSATGTCLTTPTVLPMGKPLRLAFEFAATEQPIRLHAEVSWTGRTTAVRASVLSGMRFLDLAGPDFARMREFIDAKLWEVQRFVCALDLFADLNDLEKLLLSTVLLDRELKPGESLEDELSEGTLLIVRSGTLTGHEQLPDGRALHRKALHAGDLLGALPIDASGPTRVTVRATTDAALLVVPIDGFEYLRTRHPETAFKLLSAWTLALRDQLMTVEPAEE